MRQGGIAVSVHAAGGRRRSGRVDIAIARTGDATGASGSGLLAAVLFDAIADGGDAHVERRRSTPSGRRCRAVQPVTVTVR